MNTSKIKPQKIQLNRGLNNKPFYSPDNLKALDTYEQNKKPPLPLNNILQTQKESQGAIRSAVSITEKGASALSSINDGGFLVEGQTKTVIYYGKDAEKMLSKTTHFDKETQIVVLKGSAVKVNIDGEIREFREPGALLLGPGSNARAQVLKGNVMVVQSENSPPWYKKFGPQGEHSEKFNELSEINKRLYGGCELKDKFTELQLEKLMEHGVVFEKDNKHVQWYEFSNGEDLKTKLTQMGFCFKDKETIFQIWQEMAKRTPRDQHGCGISGYDYTGLAWDKGTIVAYLLKNKLNLWSWRPTEWIVNSTEYAGRNEPFCVGISNVISKENYKEPVAFKEEIRPAETLHRHPVMGEKKQTEIYIAMGGRAALLTINNGKPHLNIMREGDMAVINPGLVHCIFAVQGEYEHICVQVPSAFQYGLMFKEDQNYSDYFIEEKDLIDCAKKLLKTSKRGFIDLSGMLPSDSGYNLSKARIKK